MAKSLESPFSVYMPAKSSKVNCSLRAGGNFIIEVTEIIPKVIKRRHLQGVRKQNDTFREIFNKCAVGFLAHLQFPFIVGLLLTGF